MHAPTLAPQNHLLAALPAEEYARLEPHLELVSMSSGSQLYSPGVRMQHAFFPVSAIVSLLYVTEDGHSTEVAVFRHVQQRHDGAYRKERVLHPHPGRVKLAAAAHADQFQVGRQARVLFGGQGGQQVILGR